MKKLSKQRAMGIYEALHEVFPDAGPELNYRNEFELLTAVILSAQCTDKRVNIVTKELFKVASNPQSMNQLTREDIELMIKTCGLYKSKAKYLKQMSRDLVEKYDGVVPQTRKELEQLSGVGRKTASVVLSVAFGEPAIAVDTHVYRVSRRIGFSTAKTVNGVEQDLMRLFPKKHWMTLHHVLILHGRYVCKAQKPQCETCTICSDCHYYKEINEVKGGKIC